MSRKRYLSVKEYYDETGMPISAMMKAIHSEYGESFSFRTGSGQTSPYYIITPLFEHLLDSGALKEVLEK